MSSSQLTLPNQATRISSAVRLHEKATGAAAQMAVAAALCGLELKSLKKEVGHGAWLDWFEKNLASHGLAIRTAQKYIALADGLKDKALKNASGAFLKLLDCAPSELSKDQQNTLSKSVAKMADGSTLSQLYEDMGIVKKAQGSGSRGGSTASKDSDKSAPDASNAEVLAAGRVASTEQLVTMLEEGLIDHWWNSAPVALRKKLHGLLVDTQTAVKETLK